MSIFIYLIFWSFSALSVSCPTGQGILNGVCTTCQVVSNGMCQVCPANSTLNTSGACTCNSSYTNVGSSTNMVCAAKYTSYPLVFTSIPSNTAALLPPQTYLASVSNVGSAQAQCDLTNLNSNIASNVICDDGSTCNIHNQCGDGTSCVRYIPSSTSILIMCAEGLYVVGTGSATQTVYCRNGTISSNSSMNANNFSQCAEQCNGAIFANATLSGNSVTSGYNFLGYNISGAPQYSGSATSFVMPGQSATVNCASGYIANNTLNSTSFTVQCVSSLTSTSTSTFDATSLAQSCVLQSTACSFTGSNATYTYTISPCTSESSCYVASGTNIAYKCAQNTTQNSTYKSLCGATWGAICTNGNMSYGFDCSKCV